jgi:hypothetical protein
MLSTEFKFTRSHVDACIFHCLDQEGTIILCSYVDDALIIGDESAMKKLYLNQEVQCHSRKFDY